MQHEHDIVYRGVTNILVRGVIVGSVDIWRCRFCDRMYCEDKRFVPTELASEVGWPQVDSDAKWAVLVCFETGDANWSVIPVKADQTIEHKCKADLVHALRVEPDFKLRASGPVLPKTEHKLFLIAGNENTEIEVRPFGSG